MTGITRKQAANAVAALFGTTAVHLSSSRTYDPWEVKDNEGKTWRFVADGSITGQRREDGHIVLADRKPYKVELNSPKLEYSEMDKLQEVVRSLRRAGAFVNSSCGLHVHVDASNHTPQSLKNALSIMYSKEDIWLLFNRVSAELSVPRLIPVLSVFWTIGRRLNSATIPPSSPLCLNAVSQII